MAHAYTPGLRIMTETLVSKERLLPLPGEVLVRVGERVQSDTPIARADLPGDIVTVNVVNLLGIPAEDIRNYMLKGEGDSIEEGEMIAENKPLIKWFRTQVRAPADGTIESVSDVTGQVLIRKPPRRVELSAFIDGEVTGVLEGQGAVIETVATLVQGIFGIGGERNGAITTVVESPEEALTEARVRPEHAGKILVGGSLVEWPALKKAVEVGARGVIAGGFHSRHIREWLGYEIGVAITGDEAVETTLILTEGFGKITMARRTFDLLRSCEGRKASITGRTQIRAGVMRPEVIIPREKERTGVSDRLEARGGMKQGDEVRVIREPYFGRLGRVHALNPQPAEIETEARVRVMEVELGDGEVVTVPRANVELINA